MNRLSNADRCRVLACLVEGNSIRSTVRITGICKRTVSRLLVEFGESCERFLSRTMTGLPCKAIQCDEIWSFVGCKAKNVHAESPEGWGDVWTWIAIDPETSSLPHGSLATAPLRVLINSCATLSQGLLSACNSRPMAITPTWWL